ncbi:hypothetical protein K0M31_009465 [Melipona bicolor]|uniref:Uncharacterized protein n=1 Tax=Melipona bicolor TaxID=60889 RepID=A0AA40FN45_9HYME|nr:hypothetical protein K0M31_009465 [Melipona bicolor]
MCSRFPSEPPLFHPSHPILRSSGEFHNPLITVDAEEGRKQARNLRKGVGALASVESGCNQPGRALEASYASLPSPPLRKSPQGDGRPRLAWLPRTREDIVHPYWLFTNPYSEEQLVEREDEKVQDVFLDRVPSFYRRLSGSEKRRFVDVMNVNPTEEQEISIC